MFKIIRWLFYGFVFVFLWQVSRMMNNNQEQLGNATIKLSGVMEESAKNIIKQGQNNIIAMQQNITDSVKKASQEYMREIMK